MAWLTDPERWTALGRKLIQLGEFGLDTETHGQPDKTSPQHRAIVHCWSIGVLTGKKHPRGYNLATGVVLPAEALDNDAIREALARTDVRKWAHNAPHDYHSIRNRGVDVAGMEDTLQWARVAVPGMGHYGLKEMEQWALGKPPRPDFMEMLSYPAQVERSTWRKEKTCVCGKKPCRAKGTSEWFDVPMGWWRLHERVEHRVETKHIKDVTLRYQVPQFVPGAVLEPLVWHGQTIDRMIAWEAYSLADAVSGIELVSWLRNRPVKVTPYPWGPK